MSRAVVVAVVLLLTGVAGAQVPPRRPGPLLRWLQGATYRDTFVAEPAVRPSQTAHGMHVRTFYNPILADDLRAGRTKFRRGAAMVKELYFDGTDAVVGWAVMRKLRGRGGRAWFFYETLDGTNRDPFVGRGLRLCTGCHAAGTDFLLSTFRP